MSNDYYTPSGAPQTLNRGSSSIIRNEYILIQQAFDLLPPPTDLLNSINFEVDTGTSSAIVCELPSNIDAYTNGMTLKIEVAADCTGPSTILPGTLVLKSINRADGTPTQPLDWVAGQICTFNYSVADGAFQYSQNSASSSIAAAASAAAAASSATASSNSATASSGSAVLASQWATQLTTQVQSVDYSAKEYAIGTATRGTIGSAKDWATYMGGTVDGTLFSARFYAAQAAAVSIPFPDNTPFLKNFTDTTKLFQLSLSGISTGTTRTLTVPNFDGTIATLAGTETLTNKTITNPVLNGSGGLLTLPAGPDTLVGRNTTDTLTNKTLTTPTIAQIKVSTFTLTLPSATDQLVGRNTTDTLTNKVLTSPVINTPNIGGTGGAITLPAGPDTLIGRATADTISGVKTFSVSPLVPTAAPLTNSTVDASTAYVDLAVAASVPKGSLAGLTMSTAGASSTMSIAAGQAANSTFVFLMALLSAIAKTTAAWAVGTAAGGIDTGSIANNTWYYFYLIRRPDTGVVDVIFSLSSSSPSLPANYTQFRYLGAGFTNGSAQWTAFTQSGDDFYWSTPVLDLNAAGSTTGVLLTCSIPRGRKVKVFFNAYVNNGANGIYISDPANADLAPDAGATNPLSSIQTGGGSVSAQLNCWSDTSARVRHREISTGIVAMTTLGWTDLRDRT